MVPPDCRGFNRPCPAWIGHSVLVPQSSFYVVPCRPATPRMAGSSINCQSAFGQIVSTGKPSAPATSSRLLRDRGTTPNRNQLLIVLMLMSSCNASRSQDSSRSLNAFRTSGFIIQSSVEKKKLPLLLKKTTPWGHSGIITQYQPITAIIEKMGIKHAQYFFGQFC